MHGQRDHAVLIDCRELSATPIEMGFDDHDLVLLVIDTQVRHSHATGGYKERRASCESACTALGIATLRDLTVDDLAGIESRLSDVEFRRVRHVVTENERVVTVARLVQSDGPRAIGTRPMRRWFRRGSNTCQAPPRYTSIQALKSIGSAGGTPISPR